MALKVGIFSDNFSLYTNKYPLLRQSAAHYKRMLREGWELYLLNPEASPTFMKRYNGELDGSKINDVFEYVKPVERDKTVDDIDVLFVDHLPWSDTDWRNRPHINEMLEYYANKAKLIIWRSGDDEMRSPIKSYLRDYLPKEKPEIYNKIKKILTVYVHPYYGDKYEYFPHVYDKDFEIDITPKSQREFGIIFGGPMGYRVTMGNLLNDKVMPVLEEAGIKSKLYGEDYFAKYTIKGGYDTVKEFGGKFKNVEFPDGRIFLHFDEYKKFIANGLFTLHDSVLIPWGDTEPSDYPTNRLMESGYSGTWLLSTKFKHRDRDNNVFVPENKNHLFNSGDENIQSVIRYVLNCTDEEYEQEIINQRKWLDENYNADFYFNKIKKIVEESF